MYIHSEWWEWQLDYYGEYPNTGKDTQIGAKISALHLQDMSVCMHIQFLLTSYDDELDMID